jgi:hypothetical protein
MYVSGKLAGHELCSVDEILLRMLDRIQLEIMFDETASVQALTQAALLPNASTRATFFRSATNLRISRRRLSLSGARKMDEG